MKTLAKSIKRNPVILAAVAIIVVQVIKDWDHITTTDYFQYLFSLGVAYCAREFTVPLKDHEELKNQVSQAIVDSNLKRFTND